MFGCHEQVYMPRFVVVNGAGGVPAGPLHRDRDSPPSSSPAGLPVPAAAAGPLGETDPFLLGGVQVDQIRASPVPGSDDDTRDALVKDIAGAGARGLEPSAARDVLATFERRAAALVAADDDASPKPKRPSASSSNGEPAKKPAKRRRVVARAPTKRDAAAAADDAAAAAADQGGGGGGGGETPAPAPGTPSSNAETTCDRCGKVCATAVALSGHKRFCDGGVWRCDWCKCRADECSGKNPGPRGRSTLCGACGSRYRAGHSGPVLPNERGKFTCEACGKELDSIGALGGHRRFCDGGQWRCDWCKCSAAQCSGKNPGPRGPATLCGACGSRYRAGHTGPPRTTRDGKFVCETCGKLLDSIGALGGHRRFCDGGQWRCAWCRCSAAQCSGKNPGPDGPATLCGACGSRYRAGHSGPPRQDKAGKYVCEACGKALESIVALGGHRRFCDGGQWRCEWCGCKADATSSKMSGPSGPATLCGTCGSRHLAGQDGGPSPATPDGKHACEACGKILDSILALASHRRFCDGRLSAHVYDDGAEWLGGRRGEPLPCPVSGDLGFSPYREADVREEEEEEEAAAAGGGALLPPLAFPEAARPLLSGRDAGAALEAWDLARHLARRLEDVVQDVDVEAGAARHGKWWGRVVAGRAGASEDWSWDAYERALLGHASSGFHHLNAAIANALLHSRDAHYPDTNNGATPPQRPATTTTTKWLYVDEHNWLARLASAFPDQPFAELATAALARRQATKPRPLVDADTDDETQSDADDDPSTLTSADLMASLELDDRLRVVSSLNDLVLASSLVRDHITDISARLDRLAALKREEWARRKALAEATADLLSSDPPKLAATGDGSSPASVLVAFHQPRYVRVVSDVFVSAPVQRGGEPLLGDANLAKTNWLRETHDDQRQELETKFSALRALLGSYRRLSLGEDRDGRAYFLLGDVWDRLFLVDPNRAWFSLSPRQTAALRATLCPKKEAKLARTLDRVLPSLLLPTSQKIPTIRIPAAAAATTTTSR
ncbi:hypothetical protein CTAYLR_004836 [Chrysophaeum taylorii]|uniref:C2H2-type domain-containing protein n=1 Tax=Chrysophaeum taylorii TaxID=2483200 RepID=A0AAD7UFQ2_9STRA|nr:hypothetical protein CTAYLR_004836 [Chrysophaeum taylorii]